MNILFFLISFSQALYADICAQPNQQDVRLGGKIYVSYIAASRSQKKYITDFKVILIPKNSSTQLSAIERNKRNFCSNNRTLFQSYKARVAYTNADGYFEFRELQRQANYILIFCDHDIQLSPVSTGNRNVTYSIGEKRIRL